jgi:hypothetical protein
MRVTADRVRETSATSGVGPLVLAGAVLGFQPFSAVCADGDTCYYAIEAINAAGAPAGAWEVGLGTFNAGMLDRTTVLASSSGGALVDLPVGTKRVWIDVPAYAFMQFVTTAEADARYAPIAVPWDTLTGVPTEFPPASHTQDWSTILNKPATFPPDAHSQAWDTITGTPSTLAGYGITDAAPLDHAQPWASVTGTPTSLSGYGIADAYTRTQADAAFLTPTQGDARYLGASAQAADAAKLQGATWNSPPALIGDGSKNLVYRVGNGTNIGRVQLSQNNNCGAVTATTDGGVTAWSVSDVGAMLLSASSARLIVLTAGGNSVEQRNGASAQSKRVYTSYTDAANYERAAINTAPGAVTLAAESAGTGSANIDLNLTPKGTGSIKANAPIAGQRYNAALVTANAGVGYQMVGQAMDASADAANGVALVLSHNVSGNRQFAMGDTESGAGIRFIGNVFDGYNYKTTVRMDLTLGAATTTVRIANGLALFTKAGPIVDADFGSLRDGLIAIDTTNSRLYVRIGGAWKSALLS